MAPIISAVEILGLCGSKGPDATAAHELIGRQVRHLARLVNDLLDLSRVTRGCMELRRERVALADVVGQAVETTRPRCQRARHRLTVALPAEPLYLDGDPARLAQVFLNLLDNACKYSERGGQIQLRAERQGKDVLVTVADTGIGIAPEHLSQVFDMFSQVPPMPGRLREGLGIGLWLVKGLVEMHGGAIEAASAGLGRGAELRVRLPLAAAPPPRRRWRRCNPRAANGRPERWPSASSSWTTWPTLPSRSRWS
jgi:signal transduction histidine kinase